MKILYCFLLVCAITSVTSGWCWDRRRRRRRRSPPPVTVPAPPPPVYRPPPPPVYRPPSPPVYRPPSPPVYRPPPSHAPASYTVISTMTIQVNIRTLLLIIAKNQGTLNIDLKRAEDVLSKQKSISTGHEVVSLKMLLVCLQRLLSL